MFANCFRSLRCFAFLCLETATFSVTWLCYNLHAQLTQVWLMWEVWRAVSLPDPSTPQSGLHAVLSDNYMITKIMVLFKHIDYIEG
jgi:hypothetical protein